MWKQIKQLTGVELLDAFGFNEARFGRDKKKKNTLIGMTVVFVMLGLMVVGYTAIVCSVLAQFGMVTMVPAFLLTVTSLIVLFFSLFKTAGVIFNMHTYEQVIVLPVKPSAIVISRFLTMYVFDLLLGALVMIPGMAIFAAYTQPGVSFYFMTLIGVLLLPILPMTVATALGALITAIAARMKHKNVVTIILSLILMTGVVVLSMSFSYSAESMTEAQFADLSAMLFDWLGGMYPPALLFSKGVVGGDWLSFLLFVATSLLLFALLVTVVQWQFVRICSALQSRITRRSYVMREQTSRSPLMALYQKELRRYFSCSIYVMNTLVGYILMLLLAGALLFMGPEVIEGYLGIPGITNQLCPFLLAFFCVVSPTTVSAISIEGKQWWIVNSLPVRSKNVMDSKLLVNLTIALPTYVVSEILLLIALPMPALARVWLILLPLAYILFISVAGLTVNARLPMLHWESETTVVKQSTAVLVCMLIGFISVILPGVLNIFLPADIVNAVLFVALLTAAAVLYRHNNRLVLNKIGN